MHQALAATPVRPAPFSAVPRRVVEAMAVRRPERAIVAAAQEELGEEVVPAFATLDAQRAAARVRTATAAAAAALPHSGSSGSRKQPGSEPAHRARENSGGSGDSGGGAARSARPGARTGVALRAAALPLERRRSRSHRASDRRQLRHPEARAERRSEGGGGYGVADAPSVAGGGGGGGAAADNAVDEYERENEEAEEDGEGDEVEAEGEEEAEAAEAAESDTDGREERLDEQVGNSAGEMRTHRRRSASSGGGGGGQRAGGPRSSGGAAAGGWASPSLMDAYGSGPLQPEVPRPFELLSTQIHRKFVRGLPVVHLKVARRQGPGGVVVL